MVDWPVSLTSPRAMRALFHGLGAGGRHLDCTGRLRVKGWMKPPGFAWVTLLQDTAVTLDYKQDEEGDLRPKPEIAQSLLRA